MTTQFATGYSPVEASVGYGNPMSCTRLPCGFPPPPSPAAPLPRLLLDDGFGGRLSGSGEGDGLLAALGRAERGMRASLAGLEASTAALGAASGSYCAGTNSQCLCTGTVNSVN